MDACNEASDHTWTCQLTRNGASEWILWNTDGTTSFSVPRSWNAGNVTPLLEQSRAIAGSSLQVGPLPELLTAASY